MSKARDQIDDILKIDGIEVDVDGLLTSLDATTLTGALPAIDGSALINLPIPPTPAGGLTTIYLASTPFTVPAGVTEVHVQVLGGGGGGGYGSSPYSTPSRGGEGAAGGYAAGTYAVSAGDLHTITVGAGGASGISGGASSFGTFVTALGGGAGANAGYPTSVGASGTAGYGTGGVINTSYGTDDRYFVPLGYGVSRQGAGNAAGPNGLGYGSGGGSGYGYLGTKYGGAGGAGLVIVTY